MVKTTVEQPYHRDLTAPPLWGHSFSMMVVNATVEQPHQRDLTAPPLCGHFFFMMVVNATVEQPHQRDLTAPPLWGHFFFMMLVNATVEQPHPSHLTAPPLCIAIKHPHSGGANKWLLIGCLIYIVGLFNRCIHHHTERTAPQSRD